jgi:hypothetical protein
MIGIMSDATTPKSTFELTVQLVAAVAWPFIALVVLVGFWQPLRGIAKALPDVVARSETITIASLSIEVGRGLRGKATPQVEKALAGIEPSEIPQLLNVRLPTCWMASEIQGIRVTYGGLLRQGLLEEVDDQPLCAALRGNAGPGARVVRPTELGRQTQSFLFALVDQLVEEMTPPAAAAK